MAGDRHFRVEFDDGSDPAELPHLAHEVERELWKEDIGVFTTHRAAIEGLGLEEGFDEVYAVVDGADEFGGPLREKVNNGAEAELIVESPERYGRDAEPVPPGESWQNVSDDQIVRDAIANVPEWSEGNIETVEAGVSFVFSHSSQAKKARRVEESTSGELMFHAGGAVDYVDMLGSDKTATTLAPGNQNVVGDIEVSREGGSDRLTHLRMVGAGEGPHQISATVVADSYTSGDTQKWDTYRDKGITDRDTLEKMGRILIAERNQVTIEADLAVKGPEVEIGDRFHVHKPQDDLDHDLRVVQQTEILDKDGRKHSVIMSNKWDSRRDQEKKRREDVENYNVAVEGTAVPINAGGGRQPVGPNNNYEMEFYYPAETVYEHRLNVRVMGLPYRAYSEGAASGGSHTHPVNIPLGQLDHDHAVTFPFSNLDHDHTVDINVTAPASAGDASNTNPLDLGGLSTGSHTETFDYPLVSGGGAIGLVYIDVQCITWADNPNEYVGSGTITIKNTTKGRTLYADEVTPSYRAGGVRKHFVADVGGNIEGDTIEWTFDVGSTDADASFGFSYGATVISDHKHNIDETTTSHIEYFNDQSSTNDAEFFDDDTSTAEADGAHTHAPQPGIIESFGGNVHYPENCDVIVNGESMNVSLGDGTSGFQESVDLLEKIAQIDTFDGLQEGAVNRIEISSDSLGHLQTYVEGDVYRQILGGG